MDHVCFFKVVTKQSRKKKQFLLIAFGVKVRPKVKVISSNIDNQEYHVQSAVSDSQQ